MIDCITDFLSEPEGKIVIGLITLVILGIALMTYLDVKAARQCTADGGSYVQTGTTTIFMPVHSGDYTILIPQQTPVYSCVHKDPQ